MRLPAAAIGIQTDRGADPTHVQVPLGNKAARDYLRVFLSGAVDQEPDKQGRVLVPQMLRDYANLDSDIVVIGVGTRARFGTDRHGGLLGRQGTRIFRHCR